MMSRVLSTKWWPDQVAGAVAFASAMMMIIDGPSRFGGTGVGTIAPHAVTYAWLALIAGSAAILIAATELDHPWCSGIALLTLGTTFSANALTTTAAKGPGAVMAACAYTLVTIYLWHRGGQALKLARARPR